MPTCQLRDPELVWGDAPLWEAARGSEGPGWVTSQPHTSPPLGFCRESGEPSSAPRKEVTQDSPLRVARAGCGHLSAQPALPHACATEPIPCSSKGALRTLGTSGRVVRSPGLGHGFAAVSHCTWGPYFSRTREPPHPDQRDEEKCHYAAGRGHADGSARSHK